MKDIGLLAGMKNMLAFVVFALAVPGIPSARAAAIDMEAGSALDFSALRGTDAPAGKYGRVAADPAHATYLYELVRE